MFSGWLTYFCTRLRLGYSEASALMSLIDTIIVELFCFSFINKFKVSSLAGWVRIRNSFKRSVEFLPLIATEIHYFNCHMLWWVFSIVSLCFVSPLVLNFFRLIQSLLARHSINICSKSLSKHSVTVSRIAFYCVELLILRIRQEENLSRLRKTKRISKRSAEITRCDEAFYSSKRN